VPAQQFTTLQSAQGGMSYNTSGMPLLSPVKSTGQRESAGSLSGLLGSLAPGDGTTSLGLNLSQSSSLLGNIMDDIGIPRSRSRASASMGTPPSATLTQRSPSKTPRKTPRKTPSKTPPKAKDQE
jgi:hypothetical protein